VPAGPDNPATYQLIGKPDSVHVATGPRWARPRGWRRGRSHPGRHAHGPGRPGAPAPVVPLIAAHEGGEACVCELIEPLGLSQPTVSHHLKVLVDAGLLAREKRGVWAYFTLAPGALDSLAAVLATG
jgi:DNA-binding transcriptional ArsR family regulator